MSRSFLLASAPVLFHGDRVVFDLLAPAMKTRGYALRHVPSENVLWTELHEDPSVEGCLLGAPHGTLEPRLRALGLPVVTLPVLRLGNDERFTPGRIAANVHALLTRAVPSRATHAVYALRALTDPRQREQDVAIAAANTLHERLVHLLSLLPTTVRLGLHYATDGKGQVSAHLTVRASSPALLDRATTALDALLGDDLAAGIYAFSRMNAAESARLVHAVFPHAWELLPPGAEGLTALAHALAPSFTGAVQVVEEVAPSGAVGPSGPSPLAALLHTLVRLPHAACVDVLLERAPLNDHECERLRAYARRALALAEETPIATAKMAADRAAQFLRYRSSLLSLSVVVASATPACPDALVSEASRAFVGPQPGTEILPVEEMATIEVEASLRRRVLLPEAEGRFRLPLPVLGGQPGLEATHPRWRFVPEGLPSDGLDVGVAAHGQAVRLSIRDLLAHTYLCGATGAGKSTFLKRMAASLAQTGNGFAVLDPHGDLADTILEALPEERRGDVVVFDPSDPHNPERFNPLDVDPTVFGAVSFVIDQMMAFFKETYNMEIAGGPAFEQYFTNAVKLLYADAEATPLLTDIIRVFNDKDFRKRLLALCGGELDDEWSLDNPFFGDLSPRNRLGRDTSRCLPSPRLNARRAEAIGARQLVEHWKMAERTSGEGSLANYGPYITNKITRFTQHELMRRVACSGRSTLDFRAILDARKVLIVRLPKGKLGKEGTNLFGSFLLARLLQAALSRDNVPPEERHPYFLLVDEAASFVSESVASLLNETRKYGLGLVMATQATDHLPDPVLQAILANVGTLLSFRVGAADAARLATQFAGSFSEQDLMTLPNLHAVCRTVAEGQPLAPFLLHLPLASGGPA